MNESKTIKCLNCGTEFQGDFCPKCGQSAKTERFTIKSMVHSLFVSVFSVDGGVWMTLKSLFTRPGSMVVDIISGKRKSYFAPFPMLLLVLSIYIVIFSFTGSERAKFTKMNSSNSAEIVSVEVEASENEPEDDDFFDEEKINDGLAWFFTFYSNHYTTVFILTIPFYILLARIFYGKKNRKKYYWGEYCIPIIYSLIMVVFYRCLSSIIFYFSVATYEKVVKFSTLITIIALSACFKKMLDFSVIKVVFRSFLIYAFYLFILVMLIISAIIIFD